jgi:osmotically-inducible protein OsmY
VRLSGLSQIVNCQDRPHWQFILGQFILGQFILAGAPTLQPRLTLTIRTMMNLLLLLRKADEMGINLGLRLLALGLSAVLLLLIAYYFLVVNRNQSPVLPTASDSLKTLDAEKRKADAALMSKVKSAIAQTKRLHGYGIGVECREGMVTLTGEVPTEIDKELAANLARETLGVKEVTNQIRITPAATPQPGEIANQDLAINVDDLELQANLRERVISVPELKAQRIEIKVQNRVITLTGNVASEAQKLRAEQLIRNYPKVASVANQLRIGDASVMPTKPSGTELTTSSLVTKSAAILSESDRLLIQLVTSAFNNNRSDFSKPEVIKVAAQDGAITLTGTAPSRAERTLAERLTKEVEGVKSVRNLIVIGTR